VPGFVQAALVVAVGVDFDRRKNGANSRLQLFSCDEATGFGGGFWVVGNLLHFIELLELGGFFELGFAGDAAFGLELAQEGEVAVDVSIGSLHVKGHQLELVWVGGEDSGGGDGGVDFRMFGFDFCRFSGVAEGEDVVFDRVGPVQAPVVVGDDLGELLFVGIGRVEAGDQAVAEVVHGGAVFIGHEADLSGEAVAECVEAGAFFAFGGGGSGGVLGVGPVRFYLFIGCHIGFLSTKRSTMRRGWFQGVRKVSGLFCAEDKTFSAELTRTTRLRITYNVISLANIEDQARSRRIRRDAATIESASTGQRKDRLMSKSPIITKTRVKGTARNPVREKLPPIHAGAILLEDMRDEEISINGLAQAIRVPANRISLIVNGKRGITAETAARLACFFGTSPQYWLNIQNRFELESLDLEAIGREVIPRRAA
jgi:addiction module HigA family antidote